LAEGLLNAIKSAPASLPGPKCGVYTLRTVLSDADRKDLDVALTDIMISNKAIMMALNARGFSIGLQSVSRHRRGDCSCGRTS
jgi:hypothetical protein